LYKYFQGRGSTCAAHHDKLDRPVRSQEWQENVNQIWSTERGFMMGARVRKWGRRLRAWLDLVWRIYVGPRLQTSLLQHDCFMISGYVKNVGIGVQILWIYHPRTFSVLNSWSLMIENSVIRIYHTSKRMKCPTYTPSVSVMLHQHCL